MLVFFEGVYLPIFVVKDITGLEENEIKDIYETIEAPTV